MRFLAELWHLLLSENGYSRIWYGLATAMVIAGGGLIYNQTGGGGGAPTSGTANLWVDTSGGTCVRHSSPVAYPNDGTECASFNAAYAAASCGDYANVRDGTYSDQIISETSSGTACNGNPITIRADNGVRPDVPFIQFGTAGRGSYASDAPDNLTLRGYDVAGGILMAGDVTNVVIDAMDGGIFDVAGAPQPNNVLIENSDWGPCGSRGDNDDCSGFWSNGTASQNQPRVWNSQNVTLRNNVFHDFTQENGADHFECNWIGEDSTNVSFIGNTYYNCVQYGIALPDTMAGTWIFDNNFFGLCTHSCLKFGGPGPPAATIYIRGNTFGPGQTLNNEGTGSAASTAFVYGNIISVAYYYSDTGSFTCTSATYDYNVFIDNFTMGGTEGTRTLNGSGTGCGSHATVVDAPGGDYNNFQFVNPSIGSSLNYHLTGAAWAPDNYVPTGAPGGDLANDIDDQARPLGAQRDAGADER